MHFWEDPLVRKSGFKTCVGLSRSRPESPWPCWPLAPPGERPTADAANAIRA